MSNKWVAPPPAPPSAAAKPADHTVLRGQQLVAYVYLRDPPGAVLRASAKEAVQLVELPYGAEVRCYAKAHESELVAVASKSEDVDALLFKLGLEGYDVRAGQHTANAAKRRF